MAANGSTADDAWYYKGQHEKMWGPYPLDMLMDGLETSNLPPNLTVYKKKQNGLWPPVVLQDLWDGKVDLKAMEERKLPEEKKLLEREGGCTDVSAKDAEPNAVVSRRAMEASELRTLKKSTKSNGLKKPREGGKPAVREGPTNSVFTHDQVEYELLWTYKTNTNTDAGPFPLSHLRTWLHHGDLYPMIEICHKEGRIAPTPLHHLLESARSEHLLATLNQSRPGSLVPLLPSSEDLSDSQADTNVGSKEGPATSKTLSSYPGQLLSNPLELPDTPMQPFPAQQKLEGLRARQLGCKRPVQALEQEGKLKRDRSTLEELRGSLEREANLRIDAQVGKEIALWQLDKCLAEVVGLKARIHEIEKEAQTLRIRLLEEEAKQKAEEKEKASDETRECAVCFEPWDVKTRRGAFGCGHAGYCTKCAQEYLETKFPGAGQKRKRAPYECPVGCDLKTKKVFEIFL